VRCGLLAALAFALAASAQLFDISRECRGDFSSAFSSGFDLHRCELTVKAVGSDLRFSIPALVLRPLMSLDVRTKHNRRL
jgi:hypothetical protein